MTRKETAEALGEIMAALLQPTAGSIGDALEALAGIQGLLIDALSTCCADCAIEQAWEFANRLADHATLMEAEVDAEIARQREEQGHDRPPCEVLH